MAVLVSYTVEAPLSLFRWDAGQWWRSLQTFIVTEQADSDQHPKRDSYPTVRAFKDKSCI